MSCPLRLTDNKIETNHFKKKYEGQFEYVIMILVSHVH